MQFCCKTLQADSPITPSDAGLCEFARGIDHETNHQFHMRLFDVQKRATFGRGREIVI